MFSAKDRVRDDDVEIEKRQGETPEAIGAGKAILGDAFKPAFANPRLAIAEVTFEFVRPVVALADVGAR